MKTLKLVQLTLKWPFVMERLAMAALCRYSCWFSALHNLKLKEAALTADEYVQFSSFPRILPDEYIPEETDIFLNTRPVPHPPFIPFSDKAEFSMAKNIKDALPIMEQGMYQADLEAKKEEIDEIVLLRDKYFSFKDRISRLQFLAQHLKFSVQESFLIYSL